MGQALRQVFSKGSYVLLAAATAIAVFILATWLPNLGLVWQIAISDSVPLTDKLTVLGALIGSIGTNFTMFSAVTAIAIAVLFGVNVAVVIYLFRSRQQGLTQAGPGLAATSVGGLASGLLGIGCAACGTLVLGPALSFMGAGTIIALLPFGGEEFGMLGVGMLGLSLVLSAREIGRPITCQAPQSGRT
jgi:hypothetical protein